MFCICSREGEGSSVKYRGLFNEHDGEWRNLLPYFIHGNLAEPESYNHVSEMVAHAAIAGARRILDDEANKNIYLVYVSAIDDSNCGSHLLSVKPNREGAPPPPAVRPTNRIVDHLRALKKQAGTGSSLEHLVLPPSGDGETLAERNDMAQFRSSSAKLFGCRLPGIVNDFMEATRKNRPTIEPLPEVELRWSPPKEAAPIGVKPPHLKPATQGSEQVAINPGASSAAE
jgi:hypothetical protein